MATNNAINTPFPINVASGGTGTIIGALTLFNEPPAAATVATALTGISVIPVQIIALSTTATLNTTVNSFFSVTYKTAAVTTTSTFQSAFVEVVKA